MLDGPGERRVGDAGDGAGEVVLRVGQVVRVAGGQVGGLELAARPVEGAELDRDARADADERRERAFVEGGRSLAGEDGARGVKGAGVLGCGLEADLDDVWKTGWVKIEIGGGWLGLLTKRLACIVSALQCVDFCI